MANDKENNTERTEDMSKVVRKQEQSYNQKQRNELIKKLAKKYDNVLSKLSRT